jgi:hypothetical protein
MELSRVLIFTTARQTLHTPQSQRADVERDLVQYVRAFAAIRTIIQTLGDIVVQRHRKVTAGHDGARPPVSGP